MCTGYLSKSTTSIVSPKARLDNIVTLYYYKRYAYCLLLLLLFNQSHVNKQAKKI